ncbi:MAG: hypothetical protein NC349_03230 [Paenibacillus sp.]|nr:hypothetical protein [Paenibacillus sp.]
MFSRFILTLLMLLSLSLSAMAERTDSLWVSGRVKDAITNEDLTEAFVFRYRSDGSLIDSIPANRGIMVRNGEPVPLAIFGYYVPRCDSTYVFDVKAPGYRLRHLYRCAPHRELDTTDAIWNMRLTYTPRGGRWVFMLDGFDMLHQLSNVNYAINASGRTVTYTNALPRYIMLSLQYRLNIQPKKRR